MNWYWLVNHLGLSQRTGRRWLTIGSMTKLRYHYFLRRFHVHGNLVKRFFFFLMVMWLQTLSIKNKASRGKQEDIARCGAKGLAQISAQMVRNKLRIHKCLHDVP